MTDGSRTNQRATEGASDGTAASSTISLVTLGDPQAAVCEGDFCVVPEHPTHAVVARRLDDDAV